MSKYELSEQIILKQLAKLSQPLPAMISQDREDVCHIFLSSLHFTFSFCKL